MPLYIGREINFFLGKSSVCDDSRESVKASKTAAVRRRRRRHRRRNSTREAIDYNFFPCGRRIRFACTTHENREMRKNRIITLYARTDAF